MLVLFLCKGTAFSADDAKIITLDKIICTIDNYAITLEQLGVEKAILSMSEDSLLFRGKEKTLSDNEVLLELVARRLFFNTAVKMGFSNPPEGVVDKAVEDFQNKFPERKNYFSFLNRFQLKDSRIEGKVKWVENATDIDYRFRILSVAKRFVDKKLELQVKIVAEAKYADQRDLLAAKYPDKNPDEIKALLSGDAYETQLREWLKSVAERAKITVHDEDYRADLYKALDLKIVKEEPRPKKDGPLGF